MIESTRSKHPTRDTLLAPETLLEHRAWLRRLAGELCSDPHTADDLTQDAMLAALQDGGPQRASLRTWLGSVARRLAAGSRRAGARRRRREEISAREESLPSVADTLEQFSVLQSVVDTVMRLDEPARAVVLLRYWEGLPPRHIAKRLSIPVETVRSRLKRGIQKMRGQLDRECGGRRAWVTPLLCIPGRTTVSSGVPTLVLGSAITVGSMGKFLATAAVVLLAVLLWTTWPETPRGNMEPASEDPTTNLTARGTAESDQARAEAREKVTPPEVPRDAIAKTGSLRIRVVFANDRSEAPGIGLMVKNRRVADPVFGGQLVHTDSEGIAQLTDLTPGRYSVETDRHQIPFYHADVKAGAESTLEIALKGLNLTGIVVDRDGNGIPNAGIIHGHWGIVHRKLRPITTTGADGRFSIRAATAGRFVSAIAPGFAPSPQHPAAWRLEQRASDGVDVAVRIQLTEPGGAVRGTVRGPDGKPVAGAIVRVGSEKINLRVLILPDGAMGMHPFPVEVQTAEDGSFEIPGAAAGDQPTHVRAEGYAPWTGLCQIVVHQEATLDVQLRQAVVCTGTVFDGSGKGLAGVEIHHADHGLVGHVRTFSRADGSYSLAGLPPGEVELTADAENRGKKKFTIQAAQGEAVRRDIRFASGTELRGRLLTKDGAPVSGRYVEITTASGGSTDIKTDSEGRFKLADCPDSVEVSFTAYDGQYSGAKATDVDPRDGEFVLRVEKYELTVRIKGLVVDDEGKPVGNVMVSPGERGGKVTDAAGAFELGPFRAGRRQVRIDREGYAVFLSGQRALAADELWDLGTIRLVRGGRAIVRIDRTKVDANIVIFLGVVGEDQQLIYQETAGESGATGRLPPGRYHLTLRGRGVASQIIPITIVEGQDTRVEASVVPGYLCDVRVLGQAPRARITITGPRGDVMDRHVVRGSKRLGTHTYLAPGRYSASAVTAAGRKGRTEFTIKPGEKASLEISVR